MNTETGREVRTGKKTLNTIWLLGGAAFITWVYFGSVLAVVPAFLGFIVFLSYNDDHHIITSEKNQGLGITLVVAAVLYAYMQVNLSDDRAAAKKYCAVQAQFEALQPTHQLIEAGRNLCDHFLSAPKDNGIEYEPR